MSAPNYAAIYNFEEAIEDAFSDYLTAQGLACLTQRSSADATAPRVAIQLSGVSSMESFMSDNAGTLRNRLWTGTLKFEVITRRGKDTTNQHSVYKATLRGALHAIPCASVLTMDYLIINDLVEAGSEPTVNPAEDIDSSMLSFRVRWSIKEGSWPV